MACATKQKSLDLLKGQVFDEAEFLPIFSSFFLDWFPSDKAVLVMPLALNVLLDDSTRTSVPVSVIVHQKISRTQMLFYCMIFSEKVGSHSERF